VTAYEALSEHESGMPVTRSEMEGCSSRASARSVGPRIGGLMNDIDRSKGPLASDVNWRRMLAAQEPSWSEHSANSAASRLTAGTMRRNAALRRAAG